MFTPIGDGNEKLSEKIVEQIKKRISIGDLKPGDKLPSENELCEIFHVSRTTVREAVKMLSALSLAEVYRGKGIFVKAIDHESLLKNAYPIVVTSAKDFADIISVRKILECEAARLAAINASDSELADMEQIVKKSRSIDAKSPGCIEELSEYNGQFHRLIATSSGSAVLLHTIQPLWSIIEQTRRISLVKEHRGMVSVAEHEVIFEAIKSRDPKKASDEMDKHLSGILNSTN